MTRRPVNGQCKTCAHPERARIELLVANGVSCPRVAKRFGLSQFSVWRHFRDHVTEQRRASLKLVGPIDTKVDLEALKRAESESLLQNLVAERARLQRIADLCEGIGDFQDATRASTAIVRVLELTAKYLGELRIGSTTINQSFVLSADWFQLRRVIATALRPHPEAQRAVLTALREYEASRGAEVTDAHAIERPAIEHQPVAAVEATAEVSAC